MDDSPARKGAPSLRWLLAAGIASCLALRIVLVLGTDPSRVMTRWSNMGDATLYDRFGWNLASQGVLGIREQPSAFVMPGYPVFVAAIYRIAGHRPGTVRWVQVVLGVMTVVALGRLARLLWNPLAETIAVAGGAVYPFFIYFIPEILTETLFLFSFSVMLWTAVRAGRSGSVLDGVLHGIFLTVGAMTRPVALAMEPGVLLLARPWARENRRRRLAGLLAGVTILVAAWGGWIARNYAVFGELVPFDTHGGFTLYGSQLLSRGIDQETVVRRSIEELGYYRYDIEKGTLPGGPRGELEADRRARNLALEMIREDPVGFRLRMLQNVGVLWLNLRFGELDQRAGGLGYLAVAGWLSYFPILLLGLAGLWNVLRTRRMEIFGACLWILVVTTVIFASLHAGKRYRVATIDPVLLLLAASEASRLLSRIAVLRRLLPARFRECD